MRRASTTILAALVAIALGLPISPWEPTGVLEAAPKPPVVKIRSNNGKVSFEVSGSDVQMVIRAFKQVQSAVAGMEGKEKALGTPPAKEPPLSKDKPRTK